ncbi:MAG: oligosaccharide flippase family protein [Thermoprotei archaeon]
MSGDFFQLEVWKVYAVLCMISVGFVLDLTNYYGALMFGLGMYSTVMAQNVIFSCSSRVLGLLFAYLGHGLVGVSAGFLAGALLCLSYSMSIVKGKLKEPYGVFPYGKLLSYSLPLYAYGLIGLGLTWADLLVLQLMAGSLPLTGVYYLVTASTNVLSVLWSPIASALFPAMSAHGSANSLGLKEAVEQSLRVITALVMPISMALVSASATAIAIAYGEDYLPGALPFSLVAAVAVFAAYSSIFTTLLQSVGKTLEVAYIGGLSMLSGISLALILVKYFNLIGVALGRILMTLTAFALSYRFARKIVNFTFDGYSIKRSLMVTLCTAPILLGMDALMRVQHLQLVYTAIVDVALFVTLGVASLLFWKPLTLSDVEVIEKAMPPSLGKVLSLLRCGAKQG